MSLLAEVVSDFETGLGGVFVWRAHLGGAVRLHALHAQAGVRESQIDAVGVDGQNLARRGAVNDAGSAFCVA